MLMTRGGLPCFAVATALLCAAFAHASALIQKAPLPQVSFVPPAGLCFERIWNDSSVLTFLPHPSGNKAVLGRRDGLIQLVTLPPLGSSRNMTLISTFLDLRPRVRMVGEGGLLSLAFHPNFASNGRFFVSYTCDPTKFADCNKHCHCTPAVRCARGITCRGCRTASIIAEYGPSLPASCSLVSAGAKAAAGCLPVNATSLRAKETRRILTIGRPWDNHVGGPIFFGASGYFYYTSGDGGPSGGGDPCGFAQNGKTFLGKILRIDVDNIPFGKAYGVPKDNPFVNQSAKVWKEVFALGLRNPWRCDVDSATGQIVCGDVGQDSREEIDKIVRGGNYGWSCYEGTMAFKTCNFKPVGGSFLPPTIEISHPTSECIIGGVVYRGSNNTCLQGLYLFNDLYGDLYVGDISPAIGQAGPKAVVTGMCAATSPQACDASKPFGKALWSWGKDLNNDAYLLSSSGVFRLLPSSACNITC